MGLKRKQLGIVLSPLVLIFLGLLGHRLRPSLLSLLSIRTHLVAMTRGRPLGVSAEGKGAPLGFLPALRSSSTRAKYAIVGQTLLCDATSTAAHAAREERRMAPANMLLCVGGVGE